MRMKKNDTFFLMAAILLKSIYRFNVTPIKIPPDFCAEIGKLMLKIIQKFKGPRMVIRISKKNKIGGLMLSNLKPSIKL